MHFTDCIFLTAYKERLLHCGAAGQFIKYRDVNEDWACGGCPIPNLLVSHYCVHLRPKRHLSRNGSSTEWSCALNGSRIFSPEVCRTCSAYLSIDLGQLLPWHSKERGKGTGAACNYLQAGGG